ncbi:MAG: hypothetical protein M9951_20505 [Burkholderiaceae bacterium]|jgi:hypothetical protein|nr:hypothetical protein [Burkholderiaceae bacterium]MEB2318865.1 hypothetical protein [Pseudomonadota bacterium]
MRLVAIAIAWLAGSLAAPPVLAQALVIDCYAPTDCRRAIGDALSPKFASAVPPAQHRLVIFGSVHRYGNDRAAAYAVAGVSERVMHEGADLTLLPLKRYSASVPLDKPGLTEADERRALDRAVRAAVDRMMQACAGSASCDVHMPYRPR